MYIYQLICIMVRVFANGLEDGVQFHIVLY